MVLHGAVLISEAVYQEPRFLISPSVGSRGVVCASALGPAGEGGGYSSPAPQDRVSRGTAGDGARCHSCGCRHPGPVLGNVLPPVPHSPGTATPAASARPSVGQLARGMLASQPCVLHGVNCNFLLGAISLITSLFLYPPPPFPPHQRGKMKGPGAPRSKGGCLSTLLAEELPSGWRVPGWAGNSGCAAREVPRGAFLPAPWVTRSAVGPPMAPQGQRQPQAGRRHCLGPPLVFSLAPGFWGAVCQGAAGPGRVLGLPKQRQGQLCRVGRLHAQPCPLPAQPCQGDPGSRIHCGQGLGGGGGTPHGARGPQVLGPGLVDPGLP